MNTSEISFSVTENEFLGFVSGEKTFRCYLYGEFTILTDHRPLKWLLTMKDPSSRVTGWMLTLVEYNFNIVHRPNQKVWKRRRTQQNAQ